MLENLAGKRTYWAAAIAAGSAGLGFLNILTPAMQQHCLHLAVGLGLYGLRQAIGRVAPDPSQQSAAAG